MSDILGLVDGDLSQKLEPGKRITCLGRVNFWETRLNGIIKYSVKYLTSNKERFRGIITRTGDTSNDKSYFERRIQEWLSTNRFIVAYWRLTEGPTYFHPLTDYQLNGILYRIEETPFWGNQS